MKEFSKFEIASIKRTAQNVEKFVSNKSKILMKIKKLEEELAYTQQLIDQWQAPVKSITGGYTTEDLIRTTTSIAGKDKDGKDIIIKKFELKYPETIIPVFENVESISDATVGYVEKINEVEDQPTINEVNNDIEL